MEIELAAVHEAGHAVMQWLVGWEVKGLQMTVVDANASKAAAECPRPSLASKSALKKRLLVLLAGNAATRQRWPDSENNWGDWTDILKAIGAHFGRPEASKWFTADGMSLRDTDANEVLQAAMLKTDEMMNESMLRCAIDRVAAAFVSTAPGSDGVIWLSGADAISICEVEIGIEYRDSNPWSEWMAGN
ncbi:hypothetical protein SH501x_001281 [Pirellulaceae bacterium SH501]